MRASMTASTSRAIVGRLHRERRERRHGNDRNIERERDALRGRNREPDAGECARPATDRKHVEIGASEAGFGEHLLAHRQQQLRMPARRDFAARDKAFAGEQRDGAALGRRFDREEVHRAIL